MHHLTEIKVHKTELPSFLCPTRQSRKRCATHVYITHFIDCQRQMKSNPLRAASYGSSTGLYGNALIGTSATTALGHGGRSHELQWTCLKDKGRVDGDSTAANVNGAKNREGNACMDAPEIKSNSQQQTQAAQKKSPIFQNGSVFSLPFTGATSVSGVSAGVANTTGGNVPVTAAMFSASSTTSTCNSSASGAGNSFFDGSVANAAVLQAQLLNSVIQQPTFPFSISPALFGTAYSGPLVPQQVPHIYSHPFYESHMMSQQLANTTSITTGQNDPKNSQGLCSFPPSESSQLQHQQALSSSQAGSVSQNSNRMNEKIIPADSRLAAKVQLAMVQSNAYGQNFPSGQVTTLSNIEAKKKFEFLEAVSGTMDAHLRYFKQGYELLHQMEPYIHQVLTYAQQSRERTNCEQAALAERMQEFRRQIEQESQRSFNDVEASTSGDGIQAVGRSSHKMIEAVMQSTAKGKVQTIKQGYLLKRSSNLRGDWKRRFFVLDSRGMLYYYRKQWGKPVGAANQLAIQKASHSSEHVTGLLGRLLSSHHATPQDEKSVTHHTVNLLTSTIKVDAEQTDLRFCFRIISPLKIYTLQAENAVDRMDWIDKITAVIASLLNSHMPEQVGYSQRVPQTLMGTGHQGTQCETNSLSGFSDFEHLTPEEYTSARGYAFSCYDNSVRAMQGVLAAEQQERPIEILRKVAGNDVCADCGCHDPDWASLNLGILLCIECSGVHRNLGVHISKVRSLTLDVKVWEPSVINLFQSLGNMYANSIWEELLEIGQDSVDCNSRLDGHEHKANCISINKPSARDTLSTKEKFIQSKYAEKRLVSKEKFDPELPPLDYRMWDAVQTNNKQMVYRLLVMYDANITTTYEQSKSSSFSNLLMGSSMNHDISQSSYRGNLQLPDSGTSSPSSVAYSDDLSEIEGGLQGCSLLHLACHTGDLGMLELLLQYGADVNAQDYHGRSPLHHCILKGKNQFAKLLIRRGANPIIVDGRGKTPLQRAMEIGAITDDELFLLLSEHSR